MLHITSRLVSRTKITSFFHVTRLNSTTVNQNVVAKTIESLQQTKSRFGDDKLSATFLMSNL